MKVQTVSKGFMVLSIASTLSKVLSLVYIPFLIAIIGNEGYGIYMAAYQVFVFMYVITNSGIPSAISKLISEYNAKKEYYIVKRSFQLSKKYLFSVGLIVSILMLISAGPLANILNYEKSYYALLALVPAIFLTSISSTYRGYFQGLSNMTPTAVSQIIEQVANTIFTLFFAYMLINYSVEAACAGGTIGTSVGAIISIIYLVYNYRKNNTWMKDITLNDEEKVNKKEIDKKIAKKIFHYAFPITVSIGMQFAGNLVDLGNTKTRLIVAGMLDADATTLYGYLAKYQQILNAPISVVAALCIALLPAISSAAALKSDKMVLDKITQAFRLSFIITLPSAIVLSIFSKPIFNIARLGEGHELLLYGSVVLVLMSVVQIQTSILQGLGKLYVVTSFLITGIVIKVVANYFLIAMPSLLIMGAIIGSILGFLFTLSINHIYILKKLKIKFSMLKLSYKPLLIGLLSGLISYLSYLGLSKVLELIFFEYLSNLISVMASFTLFGFIYLVLLTIFKAIQPEDFNALPMGKKINKFIKKLTGKLA
jgi:stage V sporulation protein B